MNSINFDWKPYKSRWYINYEACLEYQKQKGSLKGITKQQKLYKWISDNIHKKNSSMDDDQKQLLRELLEEETGDLSRSYMRKILPAEEFEKRNPDAWTINYEACLAYQQQKGSESKRVV